MSDKSRRRGKRNTTFEQRMRGKSIGMSKRSQHGHRRRKLREQGIDPDPDRGTLPPKAVKPEAVAAGDLVTRVWRVEARVRCADCSRTVYRQGWHAGAVTRALVRNGWTVDSENRWRCIPCSKARKEAGEDGDVDIRATAELVPVEQSLEEVGEVRPRDMPVYDGIRLTTNQYAAFWVYQRTGDRDAACRAARITKWKLASWRKTGWWKAMESEHVADKNADLERALTDRDEQLVEAYENILTGDYPAERMASAVAQLIKIRSSIGKSPLIVSRPEHVTNTQFNVSGDMKVISSEQIADLPHGAVRDILLGRKPPPE